MFRITAATAAAVAMIAVAAPATSQTIIDQLIGKVTKRRTASAASPDATGNLAPATPAQTAEMDRLISQKLQDARIAADRQAALPVIRTMVETAACASAGEAWNVRNGLMMRPQTFGGYVPAITPMLRTQYHDKSNCMDVTRIGDWSKPATNALKFRAYFVAADSGEAANVTFELQRTGDGEWLVHNFGGAGRLMHRHHSATLVRDRIHSSFAALSLLAVVVAHSILLTAGGG